MGPSPSPGTPLKARILDVSKDTGIVDVSLKPTVLEAAAAADVSSRGGLVPEDVKSDKEKKSKKRKAEEALDAAHAADSALKVASASVLCCFGCFRQLKLAVLVAGDKLNLLLRLL